MNFTRATKRRSEPAAAQAPAPDEQHALPRGYGIETYMAARSEWNERYGDYISQAKNWRLAAILSICIALVSAAGNVYQGSQNHIVPYIVEVNQLGDALAAQRADVATTPDTRLIRSSLARWISDTRTVYLDAGAERHIINEAYGMVDGHSTAFQQLNDYYRANDPFSEAQTSTVDVQITSVLPISQNTWQIEWNEFQRKRDGTLIAEVHMRGDITETINPPTDESSLLVNPVGLYVQNFSWSPVQ